VVAAAGDVTWVIVRPRGPRDTQDGDSGGDAPVE
jgi:hypothetical protein